MNKWAELLIGFILVAVPIIVAINNPVLGAATMQFLMGAVIIGIVLVGLLFLMLGISDLKS